MGLSIVSQTRCRMDVFPAFALPPVLDRSSIIDGIARFTFLIQPPECSMQVTVTPNLRFLHVVQYIQQQCLGQAYNLHLLVRFNIMRCVPLALRIPLIPLSGHNNESMPAQSALSSITIVMALPLTSSHRTMEVTNNLGTEADRDVRSLCRELSTLKDDYADLQDKLDVLSHSTSRKLATQTAELTSRECQVDSPSAELHVSHHAVIVHSSEALRLQSAFDTQAKQI
ncbi:hypothetical protein EDB86DRAFT_2233129 [Lactarius hatsudake]|nr:hypothetical protein EDB86DRAFT_2233129 [Lactarius hatsudake]